MREENSMFLLNFEKPYLKIELQLFSEGAGDSGTSDGVVTGQAAADNSESQTNGSGENTNVADSKEGVEPSRADLYKKFKLDFKNEIDSEMEKAIKGRLKKANVFKGKVTPIIDLLCEKYGCSSDDLDALSKAVTEDESFYEEEALKEGMTVAQLKQMKKLKRENKAFKDAYEARQQQEQEQSVWNALQEEAESVKNIYSSFDLKTELNNPAFSRLLKSNVPMQTAYEVIHKDEIIPMAMQIASQKAAERVANSVASNKARPSENGMTNQSPAITRVDISKLTSKQMEEYKARARKGEKITFKE